MPSKPATVKKKKGVSGLEPPRRPAQIKSRYAFDSTPQDRNPPPPWRRLADVVSLPVHVARLRARLSADLLASDPDQHELARAWGDR